MQHFKLNINGKDYDVELKEKWSLLYVLREVIDLTGTKCGCNTGDCGACKVLIDGEAVNSCTVTAARAEGKKIVTIEGIADGLKLHPIQEAFIETGAVQCGFCTPGMIISAKALLDKNPHPTRGEVADALSNNICRCTGYVKIIDAVQLAAKKIGGEA